MKLDRTDQAILTELQRDGRISNRDLADRVHLSESACLRRVRGLEQAGVIDRYAALVSQARVGLPGNVFVSITLNRQEQGDLAAFEEAVKRVPEVMECYLMTGQQDYLLRVVVVRPGGLRAAAQPAPDAPAWRRASAVELCAAHRAQEHRAAGTGLNASRRPARPCRGYATNAATKLGPCREVVASMAADMTDSFAATRRSGLAVRASAACAAFALLAGQARGAGTEGGARTVAAAGRRACGARATVRCADARGPRRADTCRR